ncbi:group III truncated hemoglobin [Agromyces aurantiacus]|uniref:Group III truncated hemoglobin n=1 Tax=Agromyces aurantiacus TaxID=165814 RepID=A0ABV9R7I2_9MICO|nr:group III truncated hemoglobin [Agromyces aurantiacus]MBM7505155.1 truncated hemoglobin YjbI [Agromyces aurantiacus]
MPTDLMNGDDVERLVVAFYETAFRDPRIGPIFTDVAHMDLAAHLPIMCDFWETVLFRTGAYRRNALQVHVALNARHRLTDEDFSRWLELWTATVDDRFAGPVAERAKLQAARIAGSMRRRLAGRSGSAFETLATRAGHPQD